MPRILSRQRSAIVAVMAAAFVAGAPARALIIKPTFSGNITDPNWQPAINYAIQQYENLFSDPITINITFQAGGGLGGTVPQIEFIGGRNNYANMKADLLADSKTANDATAYANLPATDPTHGRTFVVTSANAKALGLPIDNPAANDGTITLGSSNAYTFDPNNRAVSGEFDFIGVVEHEISEVMGRVGILGQFGHSDDPLDLFGYSAPGVLDLNQDEAGVYFSIDGGNTSLRVYNDGSNGGDNKDWSSLDNNNNSQGPDSYNAFLSPGVQYNISAVDLQEMDVIGYDLVPEPASLGLLAVGTLGLIVRRRRSF